MTSHCNNSPCKRPAEVKATVAGNPFVLCLACSKLARFAAVKFEALVAAKA